MEAFTVLKETSDAEKLRGLTLDMRALMEDNCTEVIFGDSMVHDKHNFFQRYPFPMFPSREWLSDLFFGEQVQISPARFLPVLSTDALRKMRNVKFLQLNYMKFNGSYEHFPKNLIWLCWHGFSLRSIPKHLCLEKIVVLDLSRSCLVDAWKGKAVYDCDQLIDIQDWMKARLNPKGRLTHVTVVKGLFNVILSDEDGMCKFYEEKEEEWIIQKEFVGCLSFQIASPAAHRICAFNLFTRFCTTPETILSWFRLSTNRNNTSGRSPVPSRLFLSEWLQAWEWCNPVAEPLWKLGGDDPAFDNGDDVSISVLPLDPTIQIMMVGILWLHEEDGNGEDDKIHSNNKAVTSHCSSSSNKEVITTHNSSDADDDVHLANVEIASRIFRNYSCAVRYNPGNLEFIPTTPFPVDSLRSHTHTKTVPRNLRSHNTLTIEELGWLEGGTSFHWLEVALCQSIILALTTCEGIERIHKRFIWGDQEHARRLIR
ncbi:hypothetical protein OIU84_002214 [Salix udensis]|uniref:Uncharacterized protein n=1 Tax=Salix udensis TaxID=889485 RepID=A0AAD6K5R0_9ROSI|nr:hypothetical protein OIU84_002214 [Salix udensis]